MKISRPSLILSSAGLGLTLVYCEQGTNCTPTKAQQILRQKIAELNNTSALPGKDQLLADLERLHNEGKISDQQFETFKKNIQEQYATPGGPADPEVQAKAQKLLEQKIAELNAGQKPVVPPSNSEIQARAEQALQQKLNELRNGVPTHPETGTVAEQILHQKIAELRTQERTNIIPGNANPTLLPGLEPSARELLRAKIAADRRHEPSAPEPNPETQARALAILRQREAEWKAGVTAETPEQTRILRLKIAESKGTITTQEAAAAAVAPALAATAPSARVAASSPTAAPAGTAARAAAAPANVTAPVSFYTSNKVGLARLNELTELYKADRVTPYDYHHERAKIVASL